MKKEENISIVVASDNHYAVLIAALLKSIELNHHTEEHIDFYIIDDGISKINRAKINQCADAKVITVKWFNSQDMIPEGVTIPVDSSAFPLTTYLRLFAPYTLPKEVTRMLYLDVDTIVNKDISILWNSDLDSCTMGAVLDVGKTVDCPWGGIPNYKELGLLPTAKYFNAGIMLIDVVKWRDEEVTMKVIDALRIYKEHVVLVDQYGLNVVFANRWKELDPRWNWFATFDHEDPFLIHFLDIKPIFKSYNSQQKFADQFFKYLKLTPFKDFKKKSGYSRVFRKIYNKISKGVMKLLNKN